MRKQDRFFSVVGWICAACVLLLVVVSLMSGCAFLDQAMVDVSQGARDPVVIEKGQQIGMLANLIFPGSAVAVGGAATVFLAWISGRKQDD